MKNLKPLLIIVLLSIIFISCSDDQEEEFGSSICGAWADSNFLYQFNPDGTGYFMYADGMVSEVEGMKSNYTWNLTQNILTLNFDGSGSTRAHTCVLSITLSPTQLILYNIENGDVHSLSRI